LEQRLGKSGAPLSIHWSGCPAGCGNHQAADIGFRGQKINVNGKLVDAVAIYAGGRSGPAAVAGEQLFDAVPCDDQLVDLVANLVAQIRGAQASREDNTLTATEEIPQAELAGTYRTPAGNVSIEQLPGGGV
jgi:ferredoxin-nitrite reductase